MSEANIEEKMSEHQEEGKVHEEITTTSSSEKLNQVDLSLTKEEERRILRKIDWNLIPYSSLLYLLSFLDRVNIGQAAVAGLKQDLRITTGNAYQIALSVFVCDLRTL